MDLAVQLGILEEAGEVASQLGESRRAEDIQVSPSAGALRASTAIHVRSTDLAKMAPAERVARRLDSFRKYHGLEAVDYQFRLVYAAHKSPQNSGGEYDSMLI